MADQVRGEGGSSGGDVASAADRRVAAIEARVVKLVEANTRGRRQMLIVAILVIVMFGIFTLFTTRKVKENLQPERLREAVIARAPDVRPDIERHLTDVAKDVIPVYRDQAVARFREVGPEVAQQAVERLKTLPNDASKQIEDQVKASRDRVLERIEPELAKRYPSLTDDKKKELLATYFHEKVGAENEQLAAKLNAIHTSESVRMTGVLEKFSIGAEPPATRPRERERQFLHALVDVLMDSDLGASITTPGGAMSNRRSSTQPATTAESDEPTTNPSSSSSSSSTAPSTGPSTR